MAEIKTDSGTVIKINAAPFKDALELQKVTVTKLIESGLDLNREANVDQLAKSVIACGVSDEFMSIYLKCAARCLYGDKKITLDLFDELPEAQSYYYEIMLSVIIVNLAPLFARHLSKLKEVGDNLHRVLQDINVQLPVLKSSVSD